MPPKARLKTEDSSSEAPWKSRFPVARIKKIMQADEDVGKVAQVVPVIISKALELFMASMIQEAARHAAETGHKRVLPGHLKMAVQGNPMFDFLESNVENLADPVHIEARPLDEKKTRKPRAKKTAEPDFVVTETPKDEMVEEEEPTEDLPSAKRVKVEPEVPYHAKRSMSIANLMSPPSPPPTEDAARQ